jgi:hypothetical protein
MRFGWVLIAIGLLFVVPVTATYHAQHGTYLYQDDGGEIRGFHVTVQPKYNPYDYRYYQPYRDTRYDRRYDTRYRYENRDRYDSRTRYPTNYRYNRYSYDRYDDYRRYDVYRYDRNYATAYDRGFHDGYHRETRFYYSWGKSDEYGQAYFDGYRAGQQARKTDRSSRYHYDRPYVRYR